MRPLRILAACAAALALPASALAAGGPVSPVQGGTGVALPGGDMRYVALGAAHRTLVERIRTDGGAVERVRELPADYGVPAAAYDGTTTGLSADGRTLVLSAGAGSTARRTRLVVLDTPRLRVRTVITLPGFAAVDAISPDGRWLYLTAYKRDLVGYAVRAYDLARGRLLRAPVVDPREPDEAMQGVPLTRTPSAGGRWAYTLYMRPSGVPFVHALDTERRTAACVDLPLLTGRDLNGDTLQLRDGGATLAVVSHAGAQALIDTRTFAVRRPRAAAAPAAPRADGEGGGLPLAPVLAAGLGALAAAALALGWRRRALGS